MTPISRRLALQLASGSVALRNALPGFVGAALIGTTSKAKAQTALPVSPDEARQIAEEAYVYFYPLLSTEITRRVTTNVPAGKIPGFGPANAFSNFQAFPDANFKAVVRPNFDTLYSSGWVDLTDGPVILSVPDTDGRYYLMPIMDMWSNIVASPGKRTSGTAAADFAILPPGWTGDLPDGLQPIQATTPHLWIIGRTQTNGPADYEAVHKVQAGYRLTKLGDWGKAAVAPVGVVDPAVDMKTPPKVQVDSMPAGSYFALAAQLMTVNPPQVTDWSQVARLARIGIVPGQPWDISTLDPATRSAIIAGAKDGLARMQSSAAGLAPIINGWQMNTSTMGVYGNAYLKRAIIAQVGLGANQPEDAIYPLNVADSLGNHVTGDGVYTMHFEKADLPPVDAFWSLTMYDGEGFQVPNPINRFAIGDRDKLAYNADGSLDILIQHADPGPDKHANWLPGPASGPIGLTMRLYAPQAPALDGRWNPPPVVKQG